MKREHRKGLLMYVELTPPGYLDRDQDAICYAKFVRWGKYDEPRRPVCSDTRYNWLLEAAAHIKPAENDFGMELTAKCWEDEFKPRVVITPEQRLRNVAACVTRLTTPSRVNVGKRPDNFQANKQEIADAARQLAEEILLYLAGELEAINSELPF